MKKLRIYITTCALLMAFAALSAPASAQPYILSGDKLGVDASWAKFQVKIRTDKKAYKTGEFLTATIIPNRECYVYVYYTNKKGHCMIIYPNLYSHRNRIKAEEQFVIGNDPKGSFGIKIAPPKSRDYLQVLALDEPLNLESLVGVNDPKEFIGKLRHILKQRVNKRAEELGDVKDVPLKNKVFAIGATDYVCNMGKYTPASGVAKPGELKLRNSKKPILNIRSVSPVKRRILITGPNVATGSAKKKNGVFILGNRDYTIRGTAMYVKGIKNVLVNDNNAAVYPAGGAKAIKIKAADDKNLFKIVDFSYNVIDLKPGINNFKITVTGMDGTETTKIIKVKREAE